MRFNIGALVLQFYISNDSIHIQCKGQVSVQLDYDNHESDAPFYMSSPFSMKGELEYNDGKLEMIDME